MIRLNIVIYFSCFLIGTPREADAEEFNGPDTVVIDSLLDYGYTLEPNAPDSAIRVYARAGMLSQQINDDLRLGKSYNYRGIVYSDQGNYDEARKHNQLAIKFFKRTGYETGIAACKINNGNIDLYLGEYEQAVKLYYEGIETYERLQDTFRLLTSLLNIGTLFYNNHYLDESIQYNQRALLLAKQSSDQTYLADIHINMANTWLMKNERELYKQHIDSAIRVAESAGHVYIMTIAYNSLSDYYKDENLPDSAVFYAKKAVNNAEIYRNPYNIAETYNRLGEAYHATGQSDSAYFYLAKAHRIADENGYKKILANVMLNLARVYAHNRTYDHAYDSLMKYIKLNADLTATERQQALQELDRKYQLAKKENQLEQQMLMLTLNKKEISRKNTLMVIGGMFILLSLTILVLLLNILKNRKKLARKEIQQLQAEKDKQVMKAILNGEENERKRIARELHDGVNGNLATLKLSLSNKNGLQDYNTLLDATMDEVRNISHNLMPDSVKQFGLKEALENYISAIHAHGKIKIHFQFMDEEGKVLPDDLSVNIYRIVQELLKNALVHAEASEILVQIMIHTHSLQITVEDDGKGFITQQGKPDNAVNSGIGLQNIENRVSYHRGTLDIHSSPHEGTSVNIEIPLDQNEPA